MTHWCGHLRAKGCFFMRQGIHCIAGCAAARCTRPLHSSHCSYTCQKTVPLFLPLSYLSNTSAEIVNVFLCHKFTTRTHDRKQDRACPCTTPQHTTCCRRSYMHNKEEKIKSPWELRPTSLSDRCGSFPYPTLHPVEALVMNMGIHRVQRRPQSKLIRKQ